MPTMSPMATRVQEQQQQVRGKAPTLILGMIGFSREQEQAVEQLLARRADPAVHWRLSGPAEADAWWANGARTQPQADGSLRVGAGDPGGRAVRLSLLEIDRPLAFAEPLAHGGFEPALSFRFTDPASIHAVLTVMQTRWLASTVARQWLASRLVAAEQALTDRITHVESHGRLLAVIDPAGSVGLAPSLTVQELEDASWVARPAAARFLPPSFHKTSVEELVLSYTRRTRTPQPAALPRSLAPVAASFPSTHPMGLAEPQRHP
jgi:hypothetical protein